MRWISILRYQFRCSNKVIIPWHKQTLNRGNTVAPHYLRQALFILYLINLSFLICGFHLVAYDVGSSSQLHIIPVSGKGKKRRRKKTYFFFVKDTTHNLPLLHLLTSYWSQPSHMATFTCKESWEMKSLAMWKNRWRQQMGRLDKVKKLLQSDFQHQGDKRSGLVDREYDS